MEPLENQPGDRAAEEMLKAVSQELQSIKDNWLEDIDRLRLEKSRLEGEIEQMRSHLSQFKNQPATLSQTGGNDQIWTQQLAQILANHLQERLRQQLTQSAEASPSATDASDSNENAYRLLSSLDSTFSTTLKTLQQDVSSYQSALAQQLGRMQTLEQQGEAILEALVGRLKNQLQDAAVQYPIAIETPQPEITERRTVEAIAATPVVETRETRAQRETISPPQPAISPDFNLGFWLIILSSVALSLQNIVTKVILNRKPVFLFGELGGFIPPTAGNAIVILLTRMAIVAPVMFFMARWLYPRAWREIRAVFSRERRSFLGWVIGSGFALFLSQVLNYMALGNIPTGIATTLLFIYPTITLLLAWKLFANRPSYSLILASLTIFLGAYLTIPSGPAPRMGNVWLGVTCAIASGICFAVYIILTQISAQKLKLHPAPFSVINFGTMLVLSGLSLTIANLFPLKYFRYTVPQNMWTPLWIASSILAIATLVGYLFNHIGIQKIGSAPASVVGATVPALTTILAWGLIGENLRILPGIGIILVTLWVLGMSLENIQRMRAKKTAPANR
jgi:drug/metabolite transporter (DMT)-like permease